MNKYGFDVFLDQFRIEAGVNFQEKLIEDLADKSMVLLLESSDFLGSEWTREEIAFTKIHRLGLLALKVPDLGIGMSQIHPREREALSAADFKRGYRDPPDRNHPEANRLTRKALKRVVARVRLEHGRAFLRRRQQTRDEMTFALNQAGVPLSDCDFTADGFLRVRRPNHRYSIWLASRPPDLPDFHLSHLACSPPKNAIIIGLSKYVSIERKLRMDWLTSVCHVRYFDEGKCRISPTTSRRGRCDHTKPTGIPSWSLERKTRVFIGEHPFVGRDKAYQKKYWEHEIPNDWIEIEQAVISLCRAVFSEDGRLVFGGHPTITPLVASVAAEYFPPKGELDVGASEEDSDEEPADDDSAPVVVYQSRVFRGFDKSWMLRRLGYAAIRWTRIENEERYDEAEARKRPPCPDSVNHMREVMLRQTSPHAMVCIGGMDGVEKEAQLYRDLVIAPRIRPEASIYTLATTGGAAKVLAEGSAQPGIHLRAIDLELLNDLQVRPAFVPYSIIMQRIVDELAGLRPLGNPGRV